MSGRATTVKNIPNDNASAVGKASATGNANLNAGKADAANAPDQSQGLGQGKNADQGQGLGHGKNAAADQPVTNTEPVSDQGSQGDGSPPVGESGHVRSNTFEEDGLSYRVEVTQKGDVFTAKITLLEGHMHVNAVYWGDNETSTDFSIPNGPLNMNGRNVDWDGTASLSFRPGLGHSQDSYLDEPRESIEFTLEGVTNLDQVDVIGVRATSTSTKEGSIKGVTKLPPKDGDNDDDHCKDLMVEKTVDDNEDHSEEPEDVSDFSYMC
jgi:hypothetical protein